MTRKQTKAALLASIKATADDNHFDGIDDFAVLHFLGHEAEKQARGRRWRPADRHGRGQWEACPRIDADLMDLLRVMKEQHGRELMSVDRYRGDYRVRVTMPHGRHTLASEQFIHPDLIHAALGAFLLSVD